MLPGGHVSDEPLRLKLTSACRDIIDVTGKENGLDIVMPDRTYHLIAESAEDAR